VLIGIEAEAKNKEKELQNSAGNGDVKTSMQEFNKSNNLLSKNLLRVIILLC
jgi:hypothetical protein